MKSIIISMVVAVLLIGVVGALSWGGSSPDDIVPANNVSIVDGKQIVEIRAKGGYQPRKSVAQAGIPTIIRFNTSGTFDCSSSVRIPNMNISKALPQSGSTDIDIGTATLGTLKGSCGMGMYPFEIEFQG
jgi:plastocyanin domain-containing protein